MTRYINRLLTSGILEARRYFPVIVVTGPRQSGKTSMCRHIFPDYNYVNLEDITTRTFAMGNPAGFLDSLGNEAIIDEVQNVPDLMSMIQVRVDDHPERRYILTGSSDFSLLKTISQSLAGRAALFTLLPLSLAEVREIAADRSIDRIIIEGLYPRVTADEAPYDIYYRSCYNTYVGRDLRDLLKVRNIMTFDSFIRLLAGRIGSEFNASAIAREAGVSSVTVKEWMSLLSTSYIAFPLMPYYKNISKRLTKMPKIYFYDTGLACFLLGIDSEEVLKTHQMRGALFENLAVCELLKKQYNAGKDPRLFNYREKWGTEVDVVAEQGGSLHLYEIKSGKIIRPDFIAKMADVRHRLDNVTSATVIFDGESLPPMTLNIRDI